MIHTAQSVLRRQPWFRSVDYEQQLASPEWQNFSREVRRREGNACCICRRKDVPTEVHHFAYAPDRKIYDYETADVALLCSGCHKAMHKHLTQFRKTVFRNLSPRTFELLNEALAVGLKNSNSLELMHAMAEMAASPNSVKRFATSWEARKPKTNPTQ